MIEYGTRYESDSTKPVGYYSETGGVDGSETTTTTYKIDAVTGEVTATSTTTIIEPIAKVIIIGSQPAPVEETPVDEPAVVTPEDEPQVEAPVEEPQVDTPVDEPAVITPADEPVVVAPVDEPQVETLVEDSIITAKGDSVTHELPELDITAILSQGHILPTEILQETTVTPTISHLVGGGAAAGGSAEETSISSQGTGNTEQSVSNQSSGQTAKTLPNTGQVDALTSLGLVVGMLGFGLVKRKKAELG
ncbi:TPA: LPXTG cell wall anchor domain-containing protein [Streptococcus suis]|uniref:LPXTG cell wall anchor domain-containing protein n=1 Tax=Streptococcus TaxID=1301 RepID=UPI00137A8756|nr:LPXTG cell wall anchor domain-containing protein [Streptococcus suis]NQL66041.1 LPXTG cell wall anchor domain-containing protein [Streptococcus suis]